MIKWCNRRAMRSRGRTSEVTWSSRLTDQNAPRGEVTDPESHRDKTRVQALVFPLWSTASVFLSHTFRFGSTNVRTFPVFVLQWPVLFMCPEILSKICMKSGSIGRQICQCQAKLARVARNLKDQAGRPSDCRSRSKKSFLVYIYWI